MGILKLSLISLKKDMSKSIFYFLTFLLTTIFIFSFFNLTFNPYSGIHLGKDDTTLVTPIAVFVIVIAMLCVFLANNFYVSNKGKEVSIILMSGASIYQLGFYLFLQVFMIMICAIPLGLLCGYLLIPTINSLFMMTFKYSGQLFYLCKETMPATGMILAFEIMWCSMLNLGYCVRSTINTMLHDENKIDLSGLKGPQITQKIFIILYIIPMILFVFVKDSTSYMFIAAFGLIGISGIVKKVIPDYIRNRQHQKSLEDPIDLIAFGFFHSDIQKIFSLLMISLLSSILLTCITVYTIKQPLVSMVALMSYISVMILMSLTIVFKIGMELYKRKSNFDHLCRLGFSIQQLKKIIHKEMICFYGVILFIQLSYQLIILCNLLLRHQITILLFFIILFIQIIPLIISYFLSIRLYSSIIPQSSIIEK
nr:FtsX-like permease family protein [uncultured Faecalibacillus sp.]